jgi:hypothetical protein
MLMLADAEMKPRLAGLTDAYISERAPANEIGTFDLLGMDASWLPSHQPDIAPL